MIYVTLVIAHLTLFGALSSARCELVPKALLEGPKAEFTGVYTNESYGYSVVIPDDRKAYDAPDPYPHHGVWFILGDPPQSYIVVQGEANSLEYRRPIDAANQFVKYLREHGKRIESTTITRFRLGGLLATRVVVHYTCSDSSTKYVTDATFALSPDRSPIFEVTLYTSANRFGGDRPVLDQILKSWKYIGR